MATSPLDPANIPVGPDRSVLRGHGTSDLGPSDSSDSGSDVQHAARRLGDALLDSDSDRNGTGERAGATPDTEIEAGADIAPDHIEQVPEGADDDRLDEEELARVDPLDEKDDD